MATEGSSQAVSALLKLRELILNGELKAGERMSELALVERLGVSRTPIRTALVRLEQEGLLQPIATGGFVVNSFNERDIHAAIEIRGTLEGLAARLAAERGVPETGLVELKECLSRLGSARSRSRSNGQHLLRLRRTERAVPSHRH